MPHDRGGDWRSDSFRRRCVRDVAQVGLDVRARRRARAEGVERRDECGDYDDADDRAGEQAVPALRGRQRLENQRLIEVRGDALVVFVDVEAAIEAEELRVHAKEALCIRLARHELPALLLEGGDVALADAEAGRDVVQGEASPGARFAKAGPDIEHACGSSTYGRPRL